jgi:uncharacterized membrane protein YbhN (UPF0104 family)
MVIVAWFVVRAFSRQWTEFSTLDLQLGWDSWPLLIGALTIWAGYACLIAAWRAVVVGWGQSLPFIASARIWALASLGKYVPGKVWAIAGMIVLAQRAGIRPPVAVGSALVMQLLAFATGSVVVSLVGAAALEGAGPGLQLGLRALSVVTIVGTIILLNPKWLGWLLTRLPGAMALQQTSLPSRASVVAGAAANLLAWGAYGVAVWLLARGLLPEAGFPLLETIGAFAAAYMIGFLVVLVPGGLGVREGVFVVMMQGVAGLAPATALAVASRLLFTLTEIGVAVPFLIVPRGTSRDTA